MSRSSNPQRFGSPAIGLRTKLLFDNLVNTFDVLVCSQGGVVLSQVDSATTPVFIPGW